MKAIVRRKLANGRRRIEWRLREMRWSDRPRPMLAASNIQYEVADRTRGLAAGGIGAMHALAHRVGLVRGIDERLHLLRTHVPYHESDHVLNIAYNVLAGGHCLEDLELRRNDEAYLNALGAQRIPDPTTSGDFCRRYEAHDVDTLMDVINESRLKVWAQQPEEFFDEAVIDADGTLAPTTGECKAGMDIAYNGVWGYHPLVVSLASTQEPLYLVNRSGNRPSHEGAAERFTQAVALCRRAGFRKILLRGDTDFSQTQHLDGWDADGVRFLFGIARVRPLCEAAAELPEAAWKQLKRPPKYEVTTEPRTRPENVKDQKVVAHGFMTKRTDAESVASFAYRPSACSKTYRVIALRKNLSIERGEDGLVDDLMIFFFITNDTRTSAADLVLLANQRCNQENLHAQLKGGAKAMRMPVDTLVANWAYMVMASLAWTLKAWMALLLPGTGRWAEKHRGEKQRLLRMEFRTFVNAIVMLPCQIVRTGRRIVYRLLSWSPWQPVVFRLLDVISQPLRC